MRGGPRGASLASTVLSVAIVAAAAMATTVARPAFAQEWVAVDNEREREQPATRWRGSTLSFDQSATTQTLGLGADYQSADPVYEWWFALKPRFALYEKGRNVVSLNLWANLYLELTNSDTTTREHELLLGPTYLWAAYGRLLRHRGPYDTALVVGPRATVPTDKAARDSGQIGALGLFTTLSQTVPLRGTERRFLRGARVAVTATLMHPFARATSPVNGDIHQLRQDLTESLIVSDVLRGPMNTRYTLNLSASGEVQLARRLELSLSYVLVNRWLYAVSDAPVATLTGPVVPEHIDDPQRWGVRTWLTIALHYQLSDEVSLSLGYYDLAEQIGPDGTRRNPFWSPDARAFLTVTGHLDALWARLRRPRPSGG